MYKNKIVSVTLLNSQDKKYDYFLTIIISKLEDFILYNLVWYPKTKPFSQPEFYFPVEDFPFFASFD